MCRIVDYYYKHVEFKPLFVHANVSLTRRLADT